MDKNRLEKLTAYSEDKTNHVIIGEKEKEQFEKLCSFLIEKNQDINLTAITDPAEIETKHFIDSLTAVDIIKKYSDGERFSLIDIGCGAGFPGLPLKIMFPDADFVLVDSVAKKTGFIDEVIYKLGLSRIVTETERAEQLARTQYRGSFDFCTARAVSNISTLLEYCLPFLKIGGHCVLYKSGEYEQEMESATNALEVLGGTIDEIKEFKLPYTNADRSLIVIKKIIETPEKYPRRTGKPEKNPL